MKGKSNIQRLCIAIITICIITLISSPSVIASERLIVAVAANFILPSQELVECFKHETGISIEPTYTSTGKLYGQIIKGAPYDVFLAADRKRPDLLYEKGLSEEPFIYARGQIVLWTAKKELCTETAWQEVIRKKAVRNIAIANTVTAPYGTAAMIALKQEKLWDIHEAKFVFPQTVAQAFQYVFTEAADVGFCAYSSALSKKGKKGCFYIIPEAPPIVQAACILKQTRHREAAERFTAFLLSPAAAKVKKRFGYQ